MQPYSPMPFHYFLPHYSTTADGKLDYDTFFSGKIQAKINDNSYRQFRVLARSADTFPSAKHFADPGVPLEEGSDVTVWCSNDYLGMSKHPEVVNAAM